jgi:hypothetical protein
MVVKTATTATRTEHGEIHWDVAAAAAAAAAVRSLHSDNLRRRHAAAVAANVVLDSGALNVVVAVLDNEVP